MASYSLLVDLVTNIQERSFYGVNTSITLGGGILLMKTTKSILVVVYSAPVIAQDLVAFVEKFADTLPQ